MSVIRTHKCKITALLIVEKGVSVTTDDLGIFTLSPEAAQPLLRAAGSPLAKEFTSFNDACKLVEVDEDLDDDERKAAYRDNWLKVNELYLKNWIPALGKRQEAILDMEVAVSANTIETTNDDGDKEIAMAPDGEPAIYYKVEGVAASQMKADPDDEKYL